MAILDNDYISKILGQAAVYGNNSFLGDYRNANAMLGKLNDLYANNEFKDPTTYDKLSYGLKGQRANAVAGGAIAGLTGVTQLANNAMQAAQINDMSGYRNQLQDYVDYSNYNYNSYDQLSNAMSQNYLEPVPSLDDIRGMSTGEKVGTVASSTLQGAQAGMQIGGPIGAAIGGAAGLISAGVGVLTGDKKAQIEQTSLNAQATLAQHDAGLNFAAAHERISDYNTRKGVANAAAKGGAINKKQSITSFADRVLGTPKRRNNHSSDITRTNVEGGVRIRFRAK